MEVLNDFELTDELLEEMENAVYDEDANTSENAEHMENFLRLVARNDMETIESSKKMIIK